MDPAIPLDEDCLYLNIWTPALRGSGADARLTGEPLPVMVWIHGGAYQCGCAMEKEFDGTALARQGVVVVSVAYRLNVFGFFSHRWLQEEAEEGARMRISDGWTNRPPFGGCAATSPFSVATPRAYASSGSPRVRLRYWRNAARRVMPDCSPGRSCNQVRALATSMQHCAHWNPHSRRAQG